MSKSTFWQENTYSVECVSWRFLIAIRGAKNYSKLDLYLLPAKFNIRPTGKRFVATQDGAPNLVISP